ncbi:MAG: hypothetical protein LBF78_03785 [Treponema sp.]|jgi:hypothetical protein|nr:hypothetical protein [Treponema sp.]
MTKKSFKEELEKLLDSTVDKMDKSKLINFAKNCIYEFESAIPFDIGNKGLSWTDEELKIVLSLPPTKENILQLAKCFKRNIGSIEQIFRWAVTPKDVIKSKGRDNDAFILQIKKIYKELGWRA